MKSPPSSIHKSWMKFFKVSPSKDLRRRWCQPQGGWGVRAPTTSIWKVELTILVINSKSLMMANLEMRFNRLYKSICVGFWRRWTINPFILQTLIFHPQKFPPSEVLSSDCPSTSVNHRMGLCEWIAWMCFTHDRTPFIHSASMTWLHEWRHFQIPLIMHNILNSLGFNELAKELNG